MTYEIWNLETGNMVSAFDSEGAALAAVRKAIDTGRVEAEFVGLIVGDDYGHVVDSHAGEDLLSRAHATAA